MNNPELHYPTDDDATEAIFYLMGDVGITNICVEQVEHNSWRGYMATGEREGKERQVTAKTLKELASNVETLYLHGWL